MFESSTGVVEPFLPPHPVSNAAATKKCFTISSTFRQVTGDHQPLDLARAFVDLRDLRVAEVPLDRVLGHVAIAAEDLDRLARSLVRDVGCEQLRHRGLLAVR